MVNEIKGGSKGESADYLLYETGDKKDCIQYVPVVSKFKLSKQSKRNKTGKEEEVVTSRPSCSHIVIAGRAYSRDEEREIMKHFNEHGSKSYGVSSSFVPFEGRDDIQDADRRVADLLKSMFTSYLPKEKPVVKEQSAESDDGAGLPDNDSDEEEEAKSVDSVDSIF